MIGIVGGDSFAGRTHATGGRIVGEGAWIGEGVEDCVGIVTKAADGGVGDGQVNDGASGGSSDADGFREATFTQIPTCTRGKTATHRLNGTG